MSSSRVPSLITAGADPGPPNTQLVRRRRNISPDSAVPGADWSVLRICSGANRTDSSETAGNDIPRRRGSPRVRSLVSNTLFSNNRSSTGT